MLYYFTRRYTKLYCTIQKHIIKMILTSDRKKRIQHSFSVFQYLYFKLFHDGGSYHIETNPLICSAYQWTSFYMIGASVMNKLIRLILVTLSVFVLRSFLLPSGGVKTQALSSEFTAKLILQIRCHSYCLTWWRKSRIIYMPLPQTPKAFHKHGIVEKQK